MRSHPLVTAALLVGATAAGAQSTPDPMPRGRALGWSPYALAPEGPRGGVVGSVASPEPPGHPGALQDPGGAGEPGFVGRAARDLGRGVADLASDGWRVLTVPTRMDGGDVGVLAGVLGVGGLLYVWDEGLHDALRRQDGNALHDALIDVGDWAEPVGLMGNTNRWYALGVVAGYLSGWDPLLHVSRDLLASHWLAAGTYNPPRDWIGRSRPEEVLDARAFEGGTSMPSGHASSIVQVAAVLSHHIRWTPARVAFWGVAGTVLLQRVDSDKHWPSDVWIGAVWGYGVSRLVLARADARRASEEVGPDGGGEPRLRIGPWVDPASGRPGVAVRVGLGGG